MPDSNITKTNIRIKTLYLIFMGIFLLFCVFSRYSRAAYIKSVVIIGSGRVENNWSNYCVCDIAIPPLSCKFTLPCQKNQPPLRNKLEGFLDAMKHYAYIAGCTFHELLSLLILKEAPPFSLKHRLSSVSKKQKASYHEAATRLLSVMTHIKSAPNDRLPYPS